MRVLSSHLEPTFIATYVANATQGDLFLGTGLLRKTPLRELRYTGTWGGGIVLDVNSSNGYYVVTSVNGDFFQYTFYGTGFDFRFYSPAAGGANIFQASVDGSTNLSGFVTSFYGSGGNTLAFTAATGQMTGNSAADDSGLSVSNLALGVHTVKITFNNPSAANMRVNSFDVVTPIHSYKTNGPHVIQNTLAIGSQGINDGRSFGDQLKIPNMAVFCKGVASSFTTTSTGYVSIGDSMVNIKSTGNPVLVNYNLIVSQLTTLGDMQFTLYVDGNDIVPSTDQVTIDMQTLNKNISVNWSIMLYLSPGYHCIQLFAKTSTGSLNIPGNRRNISAVEITA